MQNSQDVEGGTERGWNWPFHARETRVQGLCRCGFSLDKKLYSKHIPSKGK